MSTAHIVQGFFNAGLAHVLKRRLGVAHCVAGPSSLIAILRQKAKPTLPRSGREVAVGSMHTRLQDPFFMPRL
jgi:hypothetical protein